MMRPLLLLTIATATLLGACAASTAHVTSTAPTLANSARCTASARLILENAGSDAVAIGVLHDQPLVAWVDDRQALQLTFLAPDGQVQNWEVTDAPDWARPAEVWTDGDSVVVLVRDTLGQRGTWIVGRVADRRVYLGGADLDAGAGETLLLSVHARPDGQPLVIAATRGQDQLHLVEAHAGATAPVRVVTADALLHPMQWRQEADTMALYTTSDAGGPLRVQRFAITVSDRAPRTPLAAEFGNPEIVALSVDARQTNANLQVAWVEQTGAGHRLVLTLPDGQVARHAVSAEATLGPWLGDGTVLVADGRSLLDAASSGDAPIEGASFWFDARPLAFAPTGRAASNNTWAVDGALLADGSRQLTLHRVRCGL